MRNIANQIRHGGTAPLQTERLFLRRMTDADAVQIFERLATQTDIIEYLAWEKNPTLSWVCATVHAVTDSYSAVPPAYNWLIFEKKSAELIGMILVDSFSEQRRTAEVDYCIAPLWRGKGFATEALLTVIRYLMGCGFFRIEALVNPDNTGSARVLEKAGMRFEGIQRGRAIRRNAQGDPDDLFAYAVIETDLNQIQCDHDNQTKKG